MSHAEAYVDEGSPLEQSRRRFMANATIVLGGMVGLIVGIPAIASLIPSQAVLESSGKEWSPLDPTEVAKLKGNTDPVKIFFKHKVQDGYLPASMVEDYVWGVPMTAAQYQEMQQQRPDLFQNKGGEVSYADEIFNVPLGFVIFSSICPHLGCKFNWVQDKKAFLCPCHGSEFKENGDHIAGPAARGLDPLPLRDDSGKAEIIWIRYKAAIADRVVISYS